MFLKPSDVLSLFELIVLLYPRTAGAMKEQKKQGYKKNNQ